MQQSSNDQAHWRRTTRLMFTHLGVWFFFGYIIHMFVNTLNQFTVPILKFPLGFYMAPQGSLIVFVVMLFVFAWQQDRIDKQHGVADDECGGIRPWQLPDRPPMHFTGSWAACTACTRRRFSPSSS